MTSTKTLHDRAAEALMKNQELSLTMIKMLGLSLDEMRTLDPRSLTPTDIGHILYNELFACKMLLPIGKVDQGAMDKFNANPYSIAVAVQRKIGKESEKTWYQIAVETWECLNNHRLSRGDKNEVHYYLVSTVKY